MKGKTIRVDTALTQEKIDQIERVIKGKYSTRADFIRHAIDLLLDKEIELQDRLNSPKQFEQLKYKIKNLEYQVRELKLRGKNNG